MRMGDTGGDKTRALTDFDHRRCFRGTFTYVHGPTFQVQLGGVCRPRPSNPRSPSGPVLCELDCSREIDQEVGAFTLLNRT